MNRRDLIQAMLAAGAAALPQARAADAGVKFRSDPFTLGVASGYPQPDTVVLWTRLAPSPLEPGGGVEARLVAVDWELATDDGFGHIARRGTEFATRDWGHSVHVEPAGLEPAREYWYRFTAGGARSAAGRTRTAPAAGASPASLRLAVASCQQYEHGYYGAYRHMLADGLDAIVHVGDYIYEESWGTRRVRHHGSPEARTLDEYRARYALYKSDPDLAAAHAACPWLLTWDDHEVENDYAGDISVNDDDPAWFTARRAAAYQAYYEHLPLPHFMRPFDGRMRIHTALSWGDLATLVMMDGRQYRSPHACPHPGRRGTARVDAALCPELAAGEREMLGAKQARWVDTALDARRGRWNLLANGVLMGYADEAPGPGARFWTDSWNGYPAARRRFLDSLAGGKVANPVVLAGDLHAFVVGRLNATPEDPSSPVVASEFVTTSITSQATPQRIIDAMTAANANLVYGSSQHRGYVRLAVAPERLTADLVAMENVDRADAPRRVERSFVVEDGRPGPVDA